MNDEPDPTTPETKPDDRPFEALREYVKSQGLDPSRILLNNVSIKTYQAIRTDPDGKRIVINGSLVTDERAWPTPEVGKRVMELIAELPRDVRVG